MGTQPGKGQVPPSVSSISYRFLVSSSVKQKEFACQHDNLSPRVAGLGRSYLPLLGGGRNQKVPQGTGGVQEFPWLQHRSALGTGALRVTVYPQLSVLEPAGRWHLYPPASLRGALERLSQ